MCSTIVISGFGTVGLVQVIALLSKQSDHISRYRYHCLISSRAFLGNSDGIDESVTTRVLSNLNSFSIESQYSVTNTILYPQLIVGLYLQLIVGLYPQLIVGLYLQLIVGLYLQLTVGLYLQLIVGLYPQLIVGH